MQEIPQVVPDPLRKPLGKRLAASRGLQLLVVFVLLGWGLGHWLDAAGGAQAVGASLGPLAVPTLILLQALGAFTLGFGEMIAVANAALFGFWPGTAMSLVAWMLAAVLQYGIALRTAQDFDFDATYARLPRWLRRFPVDHPAFLIGVRLPLGGSVVNTAAGVFGVPLWRHIWCAAIGILPRAMVFAGLGVGFLR